MGRLYKDPKSSGGKIVGVSVPSTQIIVYKVEIKQSGKVCDLCIGQQY